MIPLISLLGKFNTGKSSFFNRVCHDNKNLFSNFKLLTISNKTNFNILKNFNFLIIDTIGFNFFFNLKLNIFKQIFNSDIILFFLDNQSGIFYEDKIISVILKKSKKYIFLIINKIDFINFKINIFYFFKLGHGRPYLLSVVNSFNVFNILKSVLNIFCFLKKCIFLKKKKNNFKILILNNNYINLKKFMNFFFYKKILNNSRDTSFFYFDFYKINFCFFIVFYFIKNYFSKKIKKISFLKVLKNIIISNLIFFFIDPYYTINKFFFDFVLKYFKSLIFILDFSNLFFLKLKIYFKKFFKNKFFIYFFYILSIYMIEKNNFSYILYYIFKIFNLLYIDINFKKTKKFIDILNYEHFLKKTSFLRIKYMYKTGSYPLIFIVFLKNFYKVDKKNYNFLKKNIITFFKLKSIFLKIIFI